MEATRTNESPPGEAVIPVQEDGLNAATGSKTMATFNHPVTGVSLNVITIKRTHLNDSEAETTRLLHQEGHPQHIIAAMLGTNQGRVNEALGTAEGTNGQGSLL